MTPDSRPDGADDSAPASDRPEHPRRSIRSFVLRAGRMGSGQVKAMETLGPLYVLPYKAAPLDFDQAFGRHAPTVLEIGFGMGDATAQIAAARPQDDFIGIEVHTPGVGALLQRIQERGLTNLRLLQHDAVEVLRDMIAPGSLAGIHVYFPDPWHKKKHNKRRLIQAPFVQDLSSRLAPGGYLHCATDWQPYAEQMLEVLSAEPTLENTAKSTADGYAPRPDWRPLTKFENRGIKLGHGVWDLVFTKR
jgi:tRNA (guanine-N7-)-methyltransferase